MVAFKGVFGCGEGEKCCALYSTQAIVCTVKVDARVSSDGKGSEKLDHMAIVKGGTLIFKGTYVDIVAVQFHMWQKSNLAEMRIWLSLLIMVCMKWLRLVGVKAMTKKLLAFIQIIRESSGWFFLSITCNFH